MLHEYEKTRSFIKNARIDYLNNLNKRSKEVVKENTELLEQMHRVQEGAYEQMKMRKHMLMRLDQYEKKERARTKSDASISCSREKDKQFHAEAHATY